MGYNYSCSHFSTITNIPVANIVSSKEGHACADCDCSGKIEDKILWVCLHQNCLRLGCSDLFNDHSTLHFTNFPTHCVHMNLATRRLWCYICKSEVFMDQPLPPADDTEETQVSKISNPSSDRESGNFSKCSSYDYDMNVGLNVGSGGDSGSDYSDSEEEDSVELERPTGLVGLQNIGNTCYMNAALQALSNATPLRMFFLDCPTVVQILADGKKPGLSKTYQSLMKDMWVKKNGGYVSASGILYGIRSVHPMFRGYHQHDTQEFLRNFMDQLHEELKQVTNHEANVTDLDTFSTAVDENAISSSFDSSEGEYETCDSGVSERSSLSDETDKIPQSSKRRLSRSTSPGRRLKARLHSTNIIDSQPGMSSSNPNLINKKQQKFRSIISDIFDGKLLSSVQCLTCNRVSSRVETFQDLSLPIPSADHLMVLHGRTIVPGAACSDAVIPMQDGWIARILTWLKSWFYGPTVTLHDCLAAFFSTDELKGDNMYSCEKCNKLRNGIKFSKVLQLPEILCIHLKRFRHEMTCSSKISFVVSFPLSDLEMKPYLHNDCISKVTNYELFSVICHHGTAGGGHYISFALNNGQWYEFDDQCVTRVSAEKVENCEAYVLFYRKSTSHADEIKDKALRMSEIYDEMEREVAYVSKQWINRFNYCAEPGPIDNSDFLCQHGSVNPERVPILNQLSVVVPITVYEYLHKMYGGCPPITCVHICPSCQAFNKRLILEWETFVQLNTDAQIKDSPNTHFLSVTWFNQWHSFVHKRINDPPGPIDNNKINTPDVERNERINIPEEIWNFFYNIYGGGPEIRINNSIEEQSDEDDRIEKESNDELKEDECSEPVLKIEGGLEKGEPMEVTECNGEIPIKEENCEILENETCNLSNDLPNGQVNFINNSSNCVAIENNGDKFVKKSVSEHDNRRRRKV